MATVAQWTRLALTGDPESATPATGVIEMLEAGASADLIARYPDCLTGATLEGDAFLEAVGYAVASKIVVMPGGQVFVQHVLSLKQGTVTKNLQSSGQSAALAQKELGSMASVALSRIECVRAAMAARNSGSLFGLSGRRRTLTAQCPTICALCGCQLTSLGCGCGCA